MKTKNQKHKFIIVEKEKKSKSIFKKKSKYLLYVFIALTIFCMFNSQTSTNVKGADISDNYSQYLSNSDINVNDDKAMLLKDVSDSGNGYRNELENDFLIPAKLSNEMFSAYDSGMSAYSVSQSYLSNLDDNRNYMSNNNSENIEQELEFDDYNINYGINTTTNEYTLITSLTPDSDITSEWSVGSSGHYSKVNDYPDTIGGYYSIIWESSGGAELTDCFGLSNYSTSLTVNKITVNFYHISESTNRRLKIEIFNGTDWLDYTFYSIYCSIPTLRSVSFTDLNIDSSYINDFQLKFYTIDTFFGVGNTITSTEVQLYLQTNNCSVFTSEIEFGTSELYPAEYTFTSDSVGANPSGWTVDESGGTIDVISSFTNHSKVVKMNDIGASYIQMYNTFSNKQEGTIEFWFSVDSTSKIFYIGFREGITAGNTIEFHSSGNIYFYNGGSNTLIQAYQANTWYHIRVIFNTNTDKYSLYINQVLKADDFDGQNNIANMNRFDFYTSTTPASYSGYIDAVDYSWASEYYSYRNYIDIQTSINYTSEIDISYLSTPYKPVFYDLNFQISSNISISYLDINVYIYNYDLETYFNILTIIDNSLYSYRLNESSYFRFNKAKIKFVSISGFNHSIYLIEKYLTITYIAENNDGYQEITVKFKEYTSGDSYLGYFSLDIKIYSDSLVYRYLEHSEGYSEYGGTWQTYNTTDISLENIEVLGAIRYGYNTLIQEIANIQFIIYMNNYEYNITIVEQNRIGLFTGVKYTTELNYTAHNYNYLNITGIIGNYSYVCLNGFRCLKGEAGVIYNRWFSIPHFYEHIDLFFRKEQDSGYEADEPPAPTDYYWTYTSYRIVDDTPYNTLVGNWSISFTPVEVETYTAKYYYNPKTWKHSDWGDWSRKISFGELGSIRLSLNFMRDALCDFANSVLLFWQYLNFLGAVARTYIIWVACYILVFLVNIVWYWIFIGICTVLWYIVLLFIYIWQLLVWVWENLLIPFLRWVWNYLIPIVVVWLIDALAWLIAFIIFIVSFGQVDLITAHDIAYNLLMTLYIFMLEVISVFINNIIYILLYVVWYLLLIGFCYEKYQYNKSFGRVNRSAQLFASYEAYMLPINFLRNSIKYVYGLIPTAD